MAEFLSSFCHWKVMWYISMWSEWHFYCLKRMCNIRVHTETQRNFSAAFFSLNVNIWNCIISQSFHFQNCKQLNCIFFLSLNILRYSTLKTKIRFCLFNDIFCEAKNVNFILLLVNIWKRLFPFGAPAVFFSVKNRYTVGNCEQNGIHVCQIGKCHMLLC